MAQLARSRSVEYFGPSRCSLKSRRDSRQQKFHRRLLGSVVLAWLNSPYLSIKRDWFLENETVNFFPKGRHTLFLHWRL